MRQVNTRWILLVAACGLAVHLAARAEEPAAPATTAPPAKQEVKRPEPAPLAEHTRKGLAYLAGQQNEDGGWGQGGGWRSGNSGRVEGDDVKDPSDMGNTCVAVLALLRSGSLPDTGAFGKQVSRGIDFICTQVERADRQSIWVTDVRDTQLQSKIGRYVDTFLAALVLAELKGQVPAGDVATRIDKSLEKVIAKIEANQKEDGNFVGNGGWASVLSQGLCGKALNRASQNGVKVNAAVLQRDFEQAADQLKASGVLKSESADGAAAPATPTVPATPEASETPETPAPASAPAARAAAAPPGAAAVPDNARPEVPATPDAALEQRVVEDRPPFIDPRRSSGRAFDPARSAISTGADAGVKLYNYSANGARIADLRATQLQQRAELSQILESKTASEAEKTEAAKQLKEHDRVEAAHQEVTREVLRQLDDERFVAGFGNNGGEEFLSHMNISESLLAEGGENWQRWNTSISSMIAKVQNADGSWSGHHCITGRTFCTSAALLTLMADRAPLPVVAK